MFVDASGRRSRTFRRFGWAVAVVCACYATTVAASLVGGSSSAPFLLIPGVPEGVAEAAEVKEDGAATGPGVGSGSDSDSGKDADTVPAPSASGANPPAGDSSAPPPKDPQDEPDPTADEPEGDGDPVDGPLGGLLGLPPLLGG